MQAVVGSSTGQVPCVKWTRGLGQMVFDGLGGCGGWAAYVVYGMWHSAFGTYRRERSCALCGADHVACLVIWRDIVDTMATGGGAANLRCGGTNNILTVELQSVVFACVSGTTSHTAVGTQY